MRRQHCRRLSGPNLITTTLEQGCPDCGERLPVYQDDKLQGALNELPTYRRNACASGAAIGAARVLYQQAT